MVNTISNTLIISSKKETFVSLSTDEHKVEEYSNKHNGSIIKNSFSLSFPGSISKELFE